MQPIRQIINDAPPLLPLPLELQHRRLEIILWPLDENDKPGRSLKSLLADMPDVGTDEDFARQRDFGRRDVSWDS
ncbi:MAG: hypothetical protein HYV06_08920 [Deltaproteobacteria bacterium]|nr:hypothetical protein [Deltaproteobacteria bacterium]